MSEQAKHQENLSTPTGFLEYGPKLIAIASFISVTSSTVYELGYFSAIGFVFFPVLSPSDFIFSFLFWMPLVALTFGAAIIFAMSYPIRKAKNKSSKGLPKFLLPLMNGLVFTTVANYAYIYLIGSIPLLILIAVLTLAAASILFQIYLDKIRSLRSPLAIAVVALSAGSLIFISGWNSADDDLNSFSDAFLLVRKEKGETPPSPNYLVLMRNFQKGILARDPKNNFVEFTPWENISKISAFPKPRRTKHSPLCALLSLGCQNPVIW